MMKFYGIQKVSLVDYDTEISTTLFAKGCNLRCPFCHNYELVLYGKSEDSAIDEAYIKDFLSSHKDKISAVCISGGEPTLDPLLKDTIKEIKAMGYKVKLDTNGFMPDVLIDLIEENLIDYVAVDIKNSMECYASTAGLDYVDLSKINRTVTYLKNHNFPYEFRTTLIEEFHTEESIESMGKWLEGARIIFLQHFEMSDNVPNKTLHAVPTKNALAFRRILEKYINKVELRGF